MILKPCYDLMKPNENTLLAQTKASITVLGKPHEVDVEVRLRFLPSTGIEIEGDLPESSGILQFDSIQGVTIEGKDIPGFPIQIPLLSPGGGRFVWTLKHEPIIARGSADTEMACVLFHIYNYYDFHGTRRSTDKTSTGLHAIYHVDLKVSGWNVEIKSLPTTSSTLETLRKTGGYGLTHIGCLKKDNGSSFDGKSAEEMLNALRFFLSFSKGAWCNPCIAVGFNNKEDKVWEFWVSPKGQWKAPSSWFDPHHCEQLVNFFVGFMAKWENDDWRNALREGIYWYLSSNCSTLGLGIGIDAGIILTQAAIERLSFEYVVRQKRMIEKEGFKNLRASDKFRLLFSSLGIPIDIPTSLVELQKLANQFNWIDAPHAITEIRNSLVHPEHKLKGQFGQIFYQAWNLGQWYLELALLKICNYSGTYGNRLIQRWVGDVEPVPWEK
jgi:hypothetical protein